jgi:hypothetical protein
MKKAFVSFTTNDNYAKLSEIMITSIHKFSQYNIILYCVNFDKIENYEKFPNLICKRIDFNYNATIFSLKPKIILDAIESFNVKNGIYVESDDIVTKNIDELFEECVNIDTYPLCPIHPHDPNNQLHYMNILNIKNKSMPYIHAHVVFTDKCKNFVEEWYSLCIDKRFNGANYDETILNLLFWKNNYNKYINYVYDPYYSSYYDNEEIYYGHYKHLFERYGTNVNKNKIYMYHGCKNINLASEILNNM